jgi:hypothetical protein
MDALCPAACAMSVFDFLVRMLDEVDAPTPEKQLATILMPRNFMTILSVNPGNAGLVRLYLFLHEP